MRRDDSLFDLVMTIAILALLVAVAAAFRVLHWCVTEFGSDKEWTEEY